VYYRGYPIMGGPFVIAHSIDSLTLWEYHRNRKREIWLSTLTQESEQEVKIWSEKEVRNIYSIAE
jgi:serine/threonine-protein kinase RIO1